MNSTDHPAPPRPAVPLPRPAAPGHTAAGSSAPHSPTPRSSAPRSSAPGSTAGRSAVNQSAAGHSAAGHSAPGQAAAGTTAAGSSAPGYPAAAVPAHGYPAGGGPAPGHSAGGHPAAGQAATAGVLDLLVTVGTDVHRFDRLMGWLEQWWAQRPDRLTVHVQYGQSREPRIPGATPFLAHDLLGDAMARARVVLTHGGPASITEARRHGHVPIVVARDPAYGEHVDDHQMLFVARMAELGLIRRCTTAEELVATLEQALTDPAAPVAGVDGDPEAARAAAVARVGQIVDGLVAGGRTRRGFGRRR